MNANPIHQFDSTKVVSKIAAACELVRQVKDGFTAEDAKEVEQDLDLLVLWTQELIGDAGTLLDKMQQEKRERDEIGFISFR